MLTYIENFATYVLDILSTFLVFARDAELSALVLGKDLDRLRIKNEAAHGSLIQDKDVEQEHRNFWGAIRNTV